MTGPDWLHLPAMKPYHLATALCLVLSLGHAGAAPANVFLEELTTQQVTAALQQGTRTIIIPVGGTEQSGPHLTLGKHNIRVRVLAGKVAQQLGDTLVAPVLAYVPEGRVDPPTEHMRFAGTISIPESTFVSVLEGATRSLWQHGFHNVVLVGDHGGYQSAMQALASRLTTSGAKSGNRVFFIGAYYRATQTTYVDSLKAHGLSPSQIGSHAGSADTALQMAVAPATVFPDFFEQAARDGAKGGTVGDPRAASASLGQAGVDVVVRDSVAAIRKAVSSPR